MSEFTSKYLSRGDIQEFLRVLSRLGIGPYTAGYLFGTYEKVSGFEAEITSLLTSWDISKQLSKVTKLKRDHSNLDDWIDDLCDLSLSPSWLCRIIQEPEMECDMLPPLGKELTEEDKRTYWNCVKMVFSSIIYNQTVESLALTKNQRKMDIDFLIKELKSSKKGRTTNGNKKKDFEEILRHCTYHKEANPKEFILKYTEWMRWLRDNYPKDVSFLASVVPVFQEYVRLYGDVSSTRKLRSRIECRLSEENGEKPDILEFLDEWIKDPNTFIDDEVPSASKAIGISATFSPSKSAKSANTQDMSRASSTSTESEESAINSGASSPSVSATKSMPEANDLSLGHAGLTEDAVEEMCEKVESEESDSDNESPNMPQSHRIPGSSWEKHVCLNDHNGYYDKWEPELVVGGNISRVNEKRLLFNFVRLRSKPNTPQLGIKGKGNLAIRTKDDRILVIHDVFYVPDSKVNTITVHSITKSSDFEVLDEGEKCMLRNKYSYESGGMFGYKTDGRCFVSGVCLVQPGGQT